MTPFDDSPGEMRRFPFDDRDADAVFGARSGPDAVPDELRDIAELVHAARRPGSTDELVGEDGDRGAALPPRSWNTLRGPGPTRDERIPMLSKFRTAKLAAAATAVLVFGATAAAAATGSLPSPVQSSVASGLSGVGISVPAHHTPALARHTAPVAKPKVALAAKTSTTVKAAAKAKPHHHGVTMPAPGAVGTVASVNGVSDPGTCGMTAATGAFTLTAHKGQTFTVNVDPSTVFSDKGVTGPSFANVCVGELVFAKGTVTGTTVAATNVFVVPPHKDDDKHKHDDHRGVFGTVASVNGVTDPGTCGSPGATGAFTLTAWKNTTFTVNVDPSTKFFVFGVTGPTFANVCVGEKVAAKGALTGTTVAATTAFVFPDHKVRHDGDRKGDHDGDHGSSGKGDGNFPKGPPHFFHGSAATEHGSGHDR